MIRLDDQRTTMEKPVDETIELEPEDIEEADGVDPDPLMSDPFDPTKIQIISRQDTMVNIITRLREDEIDMNTDFQRHADLWSPQQMSRLIESILIRFPLPAFYFDASDDNKWLIVDGLQRLSSIRKFVIDDTDDRLHLRGLEYIHDLNGKTYAGLPRQYQRRIEECPITLFLIQPGTPQEVKYSVFRRINTGGLVLNNQEIRNAMSKPRERKFLSDLTRDKNMIKTMGDQSKRMKDQELVLRFMAFYDSDFQKSKKNIAEFLDDAMEKLKKSSDDKLVEFSNVFRRVIRYCGEIFGEEAFEKRTGSASEGRRRKNSSLFEAWTVNLARLNDAEAEVLIRKRDKVVSKLRDLLGDENSDFFRSISMATQKRDNVRTRHDVIRGIIQEVLND